MKLLSLLSILFVASNHPVSHIILLISSTLLSMTILMLLKTSWVSMMFSLMMLGGMLILFIYISSLASNEEFHLNSTWLILWPIILIPSQLFQLDGFSLMNLNKIYSSINFMNSALSVSYLLLALLVVIEIISQYKSSLRSNN